MAATVWQDASGFHMNIWQTNPWRFYTTWSWSDVPGQNCLAGATGTIEFPEGGLYSSTTFSWGLVRADATAVTVVTDTGSESDSPVLVGPEALPGLRPWLSQKMSRDSIVRFRAIGGVSITLHVAEPPTWDSRPDTC